MNDFERAAERTHTRALDENDHFTLAQSLFHGAALDLVLRAGFRPKSVAEALLAEAAALTSAMTGDPGLIDAAARAAGWTTEADSHG